MASDGENVVMRTMSRVFRFLGASSSSEIQDRGKKSPADSVNYGAYTTDELRHMDGLLVTINKDKPPQKPIPEEGSIQPYLESVQDNVHSKMEEIRNLTCVAPEIKVSKRVIVSTIMSPQDLQTNKINITLNYDGVSSDVKNQIVEKLNAFFNEEFHLASKLSAWLTTAGFDEGAKAIMVLPKHELDVQNAIADVLSANESLNDALHASAKNIANAEEDLYTVLPDRGSLESRMIDPKLYRDREALDVYLDVAIESLMDSLGSDEYFKNHPKGIKVGEETVTTTQQLTESLKKGTFKLLKQNGDGTVVVTRDLNQIKKGASKNSDVLNQLLKDAKAQLTGFDPDNQNGVVTANVRCFSVSDTIKVGENDLPIVIELPSDCVIPVCAPRDNKNHIGYFVLLDDDGQPLSGKNNYFKSGSTDVSNRLAMSAAKGVYGNATLTSFSELANSPEMVLKQMSDVFAVAVNKLLESKLSRDGLTGLQVNVHNAVGKAMFLNLLAKNKIKMVFVPEPMMIYYRFDHREDGTGKTLLEDASQMLALRTTLMVARLMAAVDNATMHRTIEVDVDEKDTNPIQTMQMVVRQALSKYAPAFSTEVQTAAESMINRNITVKPKSIAGTTDNLSVTMEKSYGNSQAPDQDLMDKLNNWIGMLMGGLPASVLNQLSENEFSRSVATTNMYFANQIAAWQTEIKPHNKKFIVNYVSTNSHLIKMIRDILGQDKQGEPEKLKENKSKDVKDEKIETQLKDIIQSIDVDLPPPAMAAKKAHFEEIQAFVDSVDKIVQTIYSDDIVVDDELKGNMNTIRAAITSKILREFLPKLGCQAIADIPEPSGIDADYATQTMMYLANIRRRIKNLSDLSKGALPLTATLDGTPGGGEGGNPEEGMEEGEDNENNGGPPSFEG